MHLDCTLDQFLIPNIPLLVPQFGTKKTGTDEGLETEEVHSNIALPFEFQRPFKIAEVSSTSIVEANTAIALLPGCTAITLGDGDFIGVRVVLINTTPIYVQLITGQESGWILPYQTIEVSWFDDCWYICDGHMVGEILNVTFPLDRLPFGYLTLHSRLRPSRTAYKRLANTILYPLTDVPFSCTTATPSVFTVSGGHGFLGGERLRLFTLGALTGATLSQDYFVEYINATTFYLNTLEGSTARLAITAQSGTHYYQCSAYGVGDGVTTMDLPDPVQSVFVGAGIGTTHNIASVDSFLKGQWKDDQGQIHAHDFDGYAAATTAGSSNNNIAGSSARVPIVKTGKPIAYGAYGIPRSGYVTRTKQLGTNYLIKY